LVALRFRVRHEARDGVTLIPEAVNDVLNDLVHVTVTVTARTVDAFLQGVNGFVEVKNDGIWRAHVS
jgi:hypothetical protein